MIIINNTKKINGAEKIRQHNSHSFTTETKPNTSHAITPRTIKQLRMNLRCRLERLLNIFISTYIKFPPFYSKAFYKLGFQMLFQQSICICLFYLLLLYILTPIHRTIELVFGLFLYIQSDDF